MSHLWRATAERGERRPLPGREVSSRHPGARLCVSLSLPRLLLAFLWCRSQPCTWMLRPFHLPHALGTARSYLSIDYTVLQEALATGQGLGRPPLARLSAVVSAPCSRTYSFAHAKPQCTGTARHVSNPSTIDFLFAHVLGYWQDGTLDRRCRMRCSACGVKHSSKD
jgi:hypothetical protein